MMKEYDDDDSDVYQQHSFYRRSSVSEVNCSLKSFCEYEDQGDSVRQIANILHVVECMVMMVRSELQFSPTYFLKFHIEVSVQIGLVE
ncbi:hypothetical protein T12_14537 [Trichinella patagoniensis]|uniref:Uncharacterized protein n=1 Tax=Trichinella patagoniensis TaxID=990121 RepID=A0A0V0Z7W6_9BILA|nr:hypothetical protein T12_14700 [Trichinella patagoniensis]KRY09571.1 hypothetical protein T12_14537 [Trichinella patagoniensis]